MKFLLDESKITEMKIVSGDEAVRHEKAQKWGCVCKDTVTGYKYFWEMDDTKSGADHMIQIQYNPFEPDERQKEVMTRLVDKKDLGAVEFTVGDHPHKEDDYYFTAEFQGEEIDYIPDPPFKRMARLFKKGLKRGIATFSIPFYKLSQVNQDAVTEQYRFQVRAKEVK